VTVIFDSGVWVSAIRFGGVPRQAIVKDLVQDEINICAEIENEIIRIMRRKFAVMEDEVRVRMEIFFKKPNVSSSPASSPASAAIRRTTLSWSVQ
jgi:predicted nucleic acid-binding protein